MGKQCTIDCSGCNSVDLNDQDFIGTLIHALADCLGTRILRECYHRFEPQGVTGIAIVSASHISVHTWPEYGYLSVDIFSCKAFRLDEVLSLLQNRLGCSSLVHNGTDRNTRVEEATV